jgi:hypothetical protein
MNRIPMPILANHDQSVQPESVLWDVRGENAASAETEGGLAAALRKTCNGNLRQLRLLKGMSITV